MSAIKCWFQGDAWPARDGSLVSMFGLAIDHRGALVRVAVQALVLTDEPVRAHRVSPERVVDDGRWLGEGVWTALSAAHHAALSKLGGTQ